MSIPNLDAWLIEFIKGNVISLWVAVQALKGIAILTPTIKDDKVVTLLQTIFYALKDRLVLEQKDMEKVDKKLEEK